MRSLHETYKEHLLSLHNTRLVSDHTLHRMLFILHTNLTRNLQGVLTSNVHCIGAWHLLYIETLHETYTGLCC
ncbi:hypothetical protein UFOVP337_49 [uncultured Caudovirales phage]|uniref:Uncharacterized protein n=1 Tax=uncultured Caudovirales phage TaxID=2100421 RepID=A0A6J5M1U7_9CAUD|nr:hypothetical protein UFOVP337_49 [uncultured Caudovirales phage]